MPRDRYQSRDESRPKRLGLPERRLDDHTVGHSKTQGKERIPPDQQRLTFAGTAARVDEGRQVQTGTAAFANRALDELSSVPQDDSFELFTGTDAKPNNEAASEQLERSCPRDACPGSARVDRYQCHSVPRAPISPLSCP